MKNTKTRTDYTISITPEQVDSLLFGNENLEFGVDILYGSLLDNYFVDYWNTSIRVGSHVVKARKHLFILEKYVNCWTSELVLTMTDNSKMYYETKRDYISQYLKDNKQERFLDKNEKTDLRAQLNDCIQELAK